MAVVLIALMLLTAAALPREARAQFADDEGYFLAALRGAVLWGKDANGRARLYRRSGRHIARLRGVRPLVTYDLDLGLDRRGRVVAVYHRCNFEGACGGPYLADVGTGRERRLRLPRRRGCATNKGAASVWKAEIAYTRSCRGRGSGVFLVRGSSRPRRLARLTSREAKFATVDLIPGWVATDEGAYSTRRRCRATLPPPPEDFALGPWSLTPARDLYWVEESLGEFGGAETMLKNARLGAGC